MPDVLNQFCRPEEVGVSPTWVSDYIRTLNDKRKMCHSFLMIRHGKVFAEGYWAPFHKDFMHRMYSVSKSFVSGAIGMLQDEGKLRITDRIADYFPDKLPEEVDPLVMEMTIRDMLMMASCHMGTTYTQNGLEQNDWLATFFNPPIKPNHRAGTEFHYDTSATYTLCALVERLTGKTLLEYLQEKVLSEIGFSEDAWCIESPEGHSWGGSGILCTPRDLARYALLFAGGGKLNGKQYLSEAYVKEATSKQIDNGSYGYGYQIWRQRGNSYAFVGMGTQYALVCPDKDFVFVCTSDGQGDPDTYLGIPDLIFDTVIDKIADDVLPQDDAAYGELTSLIGSLRVSVPFGEKDSPLMKSVDGVTYKLDENPMGMKDFTLRFTEDGGSVLYRTDRGDKVFHFGRGEYRDTELPEIKYFGKRISVPANHGYRCLNTGVWVSPDTFLLRTFVIDAYFGNMSAVFTFGEGEVKLAISKTAEWFLDEYVGVARGIIE